MHKLTFHNLGNADCTRIDLANGRKVLVDYANMRCADDPADKRVDLPQALRHDLRLARRNDYDVVVFTHLDNDHICGATDFFHFEHDAALQSNGRVQMQEMWVPAAVLLEDDLDGDALTIHKEAWYRIRAGRGIRVFSSPGLLTAALARRGINAAHVQPLLVNAGETVPGFSLEADGVEFFAHSPFATRTDRNELVNRNADSIAFQATFLDGGRTTRALFFADITHDVIADIVGVTEFHGRRDSTRYDRLRWNVVKVAHHSSYTAVGPDKGDTKTVPNPNVERLLEGADPYGIPYGGAEHSGALIVSTSKPIPTNDDDPQPPHRQAAAYYRDAAGTHSGAFKVTMEHPSASRPQPLVIKIDGFGATVEKTTTGGVGPVVTPAPRAGHR